MPTRSMRESALDLGFAYGVKTPCVMKMRSSESPRMRFAPESSIRTRNACTTVCCAQRGGPRRGAGVGGARGGGRCVRRIAARAAVLGGGGERDEEAGGALGVLVVGGRNRLAAQACVEGARRELHLPRAIRLDA